MLRKSCWAMLVPGAPTEARIAPAGFPVQALCPYGRDALSIAFFKTPVMERLYSGVTNISPWDGSDLGFPSRTPKGFQASVFLYTVPSLMMTTRLCR
jgi:hypothetical protein